MIEKRDFDDFDELSEFIMTEILPIKGNKLINIQQREVKYAGECDHVTWYTVFYYEQIIKKNKVITRTKKIWKTHFVRWG